MDIMHHDILKFHSLRCVIAQFFLFSSRLENIRIFTCTSTFSTQNQAWTLMTETAYSNISDALISFLNSIYTPYFYEFEFHIVYMCLYRVQNKYIENHYLTHKYIYEKYRFLLLYCKLVILVANVSIIFTESFYSSFFWRGEGGGDCMHLNGVYAYINR